MYITANNEDVEIVEEQRDDDRFLVAKNVPIVKPMELETGYVPEASIEQSTEIENTHGGTGWGGTVPTVNHPRNHPEFSWHDPSRPSDDIVLAANEDVQETLGVGEIENDSFDGEYVRADIAVNADRATDMGGEAAEIVSALESDGPLEVSSQYLHAVLPAGNYDGEFRTNAKAIAAPDSVALMPNGKGVCSVGEGCGIAPSVTANVADYPDVAGPDDSDNPAVGVMGEGQRTMDNGSQMAGVRQVLGGVMSLLPSAVGPTTDGTTKSQTTGSPENDSHDDGTAGESESDESAESDTDDDTTANTSMQDNIDREELIAFITANSELNEDSLEHMGDQCLENTHEMVVANAADDGSDGSDADGGDGDGTDDDDDDPDGDADADGDGGDTDDGLDDVMNRLDDLEDRMVTEDSIDQHVEATANQLEAEERAKNIVANSAEYESDDVEWIAELPEKELERKETAANASGGLPASTGGSIPATGNAGGEGDVDTDDMPDLEVN